MVADDAPDAGDVIWVDLDPRVGREQGGHRPVVVLSARRYNARVGLLLACPLTTRIKGYTFEVPIAGETQAVALADQVRCLDWRGRGATRKGAVTARELAAIRARVRALLG